MMQRVVDEGPAPEASDRKLCRLQAKPGQPRFGRPRLQHLHIVVHRVRSGAPGRCPGSIAVSSGDRSHNSKFGGTRSQHRSRLDVIRAYLGTKRGTVGHSGWTNLLSTTAICNNRQSLPAGAAARLPAEWRMSTWPTDEPPGPPGRDQDPRRIGTPRDDGFVERFRREASAAAGLNHPNIVAVYDRGEAEGTYYIAMEFLDGPTLKQEITSARRCPRPRRSAGPRRRWTRSTSHTAAG